eukprot:1841146-Amphidinium_carterae.1
MAGSQVVMSWQLLKGLCASSSSKQNFVDVCSRMKWGGRRPPRISGVRNAWRTILERDGFSQHE